VISSIRKYFIFLLKLAAALLVIFYLNKKGLLKLSSVASSFSLSNIILIFLLLFFVILTGTIRWFILLRSQRIKVNFLRCFRLFYIGYAFNYVLPGGVTGDVIKISNIIKNNSSKSSAGLSVVVDRVFGLLACCLIILFFIPEIFFQVNEKKWFFMSSAEFLLLYYIVVTAFLGLCSAMVFLILNNGKIHRFIITFFHRRKNVVSKLLSSVTKAVFAYRKSMKVLIINIVIAIFAQIIIALALCVIAKDIIIDFSLAITDINIASIIAQIVSLVPIVPGGIGVGEAAFAKSLFYLNGRIWMDFASIYLSFRIFNIAFSLPGLLWFVFRKEEFPNS
jgi:uncharacterized protein (TIRG00374 family)